MNQPDSDERLEAHLRRTLQEVARTTPRVITPFHPLRRRTGTWHRVTVAAAAGVIAVAGLAGVVALRSQVGAPSHGGEGSVPSSEVSLPTPTADPVAGSLLATPVPSDVQAFVGIDRSGWRVAHGPWAGQGGFARPSAGCPGCGVERLVLVEDGPALLGGAVFTAWTIDEEYDLDQLDVAVTVGNVDGRAMIRESTPTARVRVMVAWPLDGGRTAFVDVVGLPTAEAVEMAAGLSFDAAMPAMEALPAGFRKIDPPPEGVVPFEPVPGASTAVLMAHLADDSGRVVQIVGTNQGIYGLLDWANSFEHLLVNELYPEVVDGAAVAFDEAGWWPPDRFGAYWIAGGWGYRAVGEGFDSRDEFAEVLVDLRLTDTADMADRATEEITAMPTHDGFSSATGWVSEDRS